MDRLNKATPYIKKSIKHKNLVEQQSQFDETYKNSIYTVFVRRGLKTEVIMNNEELIITHISIKRNDNRALTDWRHFQWIKNQICGDESEGIEIYPAESRLVDGADQYHIWVVENKGFIFPFGFFERVVTQKQFFGETQRKFPPNRMPKDLEQCEQKLDKHIEDLEREHGNAIQRNFEPPV